MARRKNPVFVGALTLCGALALGELYLIYERWSTMRAASAKLQQNQNDLANMASVIPPPSRDVAQAIEADLARAEAALVSMRAELKGKGTAVEKMRATKVPAARTDAYFDLATYVEKMRELARKNDVAIHVEASRFGFASYTNEGPEADRIESVFRQRQVIQYLTEALLEARPT
ncbi:MAG TPA: Amuc_1100 family pilus-like protein, partial [Opitutaceae bacterium]